MTTFLSKQVPRSDDHGFRDLSRSSKHLRVLLWVSIVCTAVSLWSGLLEVELLQQIRSGVPVSEAEANISDAREGAIGAISTILILGTRILFLRWTYLTNQNAWALGAVGMENSPGWAVGWYFVPIATLWKPYQALRETFKASHPDYTDDWALAPRPRILPVWWSILIVSSLGDFKLAIDSWTAESLDELLSVSTREAIYDALYIPLCIVTIVVVRSLWRWQSVKHRSQGVGLLNDRFVE